jgi:hypothetical protein
MFYLSIALVFQLSTDRFIKWRTPDLAIRFGNEAYANLKLHPDAHATPLEHDFHVTIDRRLVVGNFAPF